MDTRKDITPLTMALARAHVYVAVCVFSVLSACEQKLAVKNMRAGATGAENITVSLNAVSPTNITPVPLAINFSDVVTNFKIDAILVTGGSASNFSGSGKDYRVDITPRGTGKVTVMVPAKAAYSVTAGHNIASESFIIVYDTVPPTAPSVTGVTPTNNDKPTWTWVSTTGGNGKFRYKLDLNEFTGDEKTVTETSFTATSALSEGPHILYVQESDDAGNWSNSGSRTIYVDKTAPTVTMSSTLPDPTNITPIPITLSFNEEVSGLVADDLILSNATAGTISGSVNTFTVDLTPTGDGIVSITLKAAAVTDVAGNNNAANTFTIEYNSSLPNAPAVNATTPTNDTTPQWTWTTGGGTGIDSYRYKLDDSNLTTGATVIGAVNTYTPGAPLSEGSHTLYVQERNASGTLWSASGSKTIVIDTTAPTVAVSSAAPSTTNVTPISYTVTFSEIVTGFAIGDITVAGGTKSNFSGSGTTYTFDVAPSSDGTVTVDIASSVANDAAGNGNTAATQISRTYDTTAPTAPNVSGTTPTNDTTPTWSWSPVGGGNGTYRYKLGDSNLSTGATTTTSTTYTPSSPFSAGSYTLYVEERDAVGNWSAPGSLQITIDTASPTVAITSSESSPTLATPIPITITFNKSVTGFDITDISVTNGTKGNFNGSGTTYTVDITPSADGAVTVNVAAAAAVDSAGNSSTAASQFSITFDATGPSAPAVTSSTTPTINRTPTWSWTAGGGGNGTFRYKLNDPTMAGATTTTSTTYTPGSDLAQGTYTLYVQERDSLGNWSVAGSYEVVVSVKLTALDVKKVKIWRGFSTAGLTTIAQYKSALAQIVDTFLYGMAFNSRSEIAPAWSGLVNGSHSTSHSTDA